MRGISPIHLDYLLDVTELAKSFPIGKECGDAIDSFAKRLVFPEYIVIKITIVRSPIAGDKPKEVIFALGIADCDIDEFIFYQLDLRAGSCDLFLEPAFSMLCFENCLRIEFL